MNTRKLSFYLFAMCLGATNAFSQVTVTQNTKVTVKNDTRVSFLQNVKVDAGGTLDAQGTLNVGGDYTNNGTVTFGTASKLIFNGVSTAQQAINCPNPFSLPYMGINNTAGSVALNTPVTILDTLQMTRGIFYTSGTNPIHFFNTAGSPVESDQSYISGVSIMDPRAVGTNALPSFLGCSLAAGNNLDMVTITRSTGPAGTTNTLGLDFIGAKWYIATTNNDLGLNIAREVHFSWVGALDNGKNVTQISLYDMNDNNNRLVRIDKTSQDVSATNPRDYVSKNVKQFNRTFVLTDKSTSPTDVATTTKATHEVIVYPNPFSSEMFVKIEKADEEPVYIYVSDISGKVVFQQQMAAGKTATLSVKLSSSLPAGMYLMHVSNANFTENFKLLKSN